MKARSGPRATGGQSRAGGANDRNQHNPLAGGNYGSPVDVVLERLERVKKSSRGWSASCPGPNHERGDRWPSLSVSEGDDGRSLIWCHAGCSADEIVRALRLELKDLFVPREDVLPRPRPRSKPRVSRQLAEALLARPALVLEVAVAGMLARLPERTSQRYILRSWDSLEKVVDIPFVWHVSKKMRETAVLRFGRAEDFSPRWSDELDDYAIDDDGYGRAVDRMMRRAER